MKLYVDQQLPFVLAQWLRGKSLDAWHIREIGLKDRPDHDIWTLAIEDGAIVVSRDSDFALFARQDGRGRLVWLRIGNCSNPALVQHFERLWPSIMIRLEAGDRIVEVLP